MSGVPSYPVFEAAYVDQLKLVYETPQFKNAPRGNRSHENLSVAFRIENPRDRLVRVAARKYNVVFNFAEVLWYLSGSPELAMIAFYAPLISKYSADGHRLQGTAYGPRLFQYGGAAVNQWNTVLNVLKEDPDSKRAFMQIFAAEELLIQNNIDVACTLGLQYFIREGSLHGAGFMRANDAFRGVVSDVFAFTFLLELMASELGLQLGGYTHLVSSYHVYEADFSRVTAVLNDPRAVDGATPFPSMPKGDNWASIRDVLRLERDLRCKHLTLTRAGLERLSLPTYWRDVVCLFALNAERTHSGKVDREKLALLPPCFGRLLENLWPEATA